MKIEILRQDADYLYDFIRRVTSEIGPRMPCSPQEARAAQAIKADTIEMIERGALENALRLCLAYLIV